MPADSHTCTISTCFLASLFPLSRLTGAEQCVECRERVGPPRARTGCTVTSAQGKRVSAHRHVSVLRATPFIPCRPVADFIHFLTTESPAETGSRRRSAIQTSAGEMCSDMSSCSASRRFSALLRWQFQERSRALANYDGRHVTR